MKKHGGNFQKSTWKLSAVGKGSCGDIPCPNLGKKILRRGSLSVMLEVMECRFSLQHSK